MPLCPDLAVVVITKNEVTNLDRLFASIDGLSNEVLVLDSGSTDGTVRLAQSYGARVVDQPFLGYAGQKNRGQSLVSASWVLFLDADEALSDVLRDSIVSFLKEPSSDVCSFHRRNFYRGVKINHSGWYPDTKIRLWNQHAATWGGKAVHESVIVQAGKHVQLLAGDLLHYPFHTAASHIQSSSKYADLAVASLQAKHSKLILILRSIGSPLVRFVKTYIFGLGILDGWNGVLICSITSYEVFLKYWRAATRSQQTNS